FGALTGALTGSTTGAATGSEFGIRVSTWTTEGWTSLVLPLLVGGTDGIVCVQWYSQLAVKESGLDEPKLGNPGLDKLVLDKLEAVFDDD
nr:hypothetical protein [Tanacetum cinerariifolium]